MVLRTAQGREKAARDRKKLAHDERQFRRSFSAWRPFKNTPGPASQNDFFIAAKIKVRATVKAYQMNKTQPTFARQTAKKTYTPYAPMVLTERS